MLSKINLFILGLISEKSVNPYRLKKILEKLETKKWLPMSDSVVYKAINSLEKKGYVKGKIIKENNNPEKTIYSITKSGLKELEKSLKDYIIGKRKEVYDFDISSSLICHLKKEDALKLLHRRLEIIDKNLVYLNNNYIELKDRYKIPYVGFIKIVHHINRLEAMKKTILDFISYVDNDEDWDHFPLIDFEGSSARL